MVIKTIHLKEHYDFLGKEGADPTLTCYLPYNMSEMNRQDTKRPSVLICPGGGYGMCSQREGEPIAFHFLPLGYNVFILNYSVAPHRFPTQLLEVAAAMELIYKNEEKWNCDAQKTLIMGFSAGGHLACHYSVDYNLDEVRRFFPESKRPSASILSYPVITADPEFSHKGSFENLIGHYPNEDEQRMFSCDHRVSEDTPPAFIWHTAPDSAVPVENSLLYAGALSKYNIPFELHIYPYGWHGLSTVDSATCEGLDQRTLSAAQWLDALKKWLNIIFINE